MHNEESNENSAAEDIAAAGVPPAREGPPMTELERTRHSAAHVLATAILRLIDGNRGVGQIGALLARSGTKPDAFNKAWQQTFSALERANRLLLATPA